MATLVLAVETWILSILGWIWLTLQEAWFPSMLCSYVFYSLLLLSTSNLLTCSFFVDARAPRVAYFNTVFALFLFCIGCAADSFSSYTFGGQVYKPSVQPGECCANCDIRRAHQVFFFIDSPFYLAQAGIVIGYIIIQLLLAGGAMLDPLYDPSMSSFTRSVWCGFGWIVPLGGMMAMRFYIMFDGSVMTLIPDSVFYLLLFSQPLLTLSLIYWVFIMVFVILMICDGFPQLRLTGIRIVRSVFFGIVLAFAVVTGVVLGMRGMLTAPIFVSLCILVCGSCAGMVEAYMYRLSIELDSVDTNGYLRRSPVTRPTRGHHHGMTSSESVISNSSSSSNATQRMTKHYIPLAVQMPVGGGGGKKGV